MEITTDQSIVGVIVVTVVAALKEGGMPKWLTSIAIIALGAAGGVVFISPSTSGAAEGIATALFTAGAYGLITGLDKAGKVPATAPAVVDDAIPMEALPPDYQTAESAGRSLQTYLDGEPVAEHVGLPVTRRPVVRF